MRIFSFVFILFLLASCSSAATAEVVANFMPLGENERFAYRLQRPGGGRIDLTLYAITDDDIENRRELFTWGNTDGDEGIQFTDDFRVAFFLERWQDAPPFSRLLYKVNGDTGEVKKLPVEVVRPWRASKDGRYIAFTNIWLPGTGSWDRRQANIFVFDVTTGTSTQLAWKTNAPVESAWDLHRLDDAFLITGTFERGAPAALAMLCPSSMELRTLWDATSINFPVDPSDRIHMLPLDDVNNVLDDVLLQQFDPNIRLR